MLRHLDIQNNRLVEGNGETGPVTVYVSPDAEERRYLVETLKIDEHTLASALDPDELSRLEFEPEHVAMIFKRPKNYSSQDQFLFRVASTGLFLFKDRLIIVLAEESQLFDGKQFLKINSLWDVVMKLVWRSIFHFTEHLKVINMISGELEQAINEAMENRSLLNLFTLEKSLVYYVNAIRSNTMLLEKLKYNGSKLGLVSEEVETLDDIIIENNQCHGQAEIYSQVLAGLMDARASIVGNNLNLLMKKLNIITICIMVPTLVVSIFSMNVTIPLGGLTYAFWIIMLLAMGSVAFVGFLWWWKKW